MELALWACAVLSREKESVWLRLSIFVAYQRQIDYLSDGIVSVICTKFEKKLDVVWKQRFDCLFTNIHGVSIKDKQHKWE